MKTLSRTQKDDNSSQISPIQEPQDQQLVLILCFSLLIGLLVLLLPSRYVDGNPVPTVVFPAHPSLFHALVVSDMFSLAGASAGLLIGKKAPLRVFYSRFSSLSAASTLSIIACALSLEIYRLLVSWGFKLCGLNEDGADSLFVYRWICPPAPPEEGR